MNKEFNPFRLPFKNQWLSSALESMLGLKPLIRGYDQRPKHNGENINGQPFLKYTLERLQTSFYCHNEQNLNQIPKDGPVVFVANHPLGGLEGVAMTDMLLDIRPDTLVLTNQLLTRIPELNQLFIGVDVLSESAESAKANAKGIRAICKHLSSGGAVLIYPAGRVSAIDLKTWKIQDREWDSLVGKLIKKYQATCIPFFVEGRNSKFFYFMGLIHRRLRTLFMARELSNKKGYKLEISAGEPITQNDIKGLEDEKQITDFVRVATDLIAHKESDEQLDNSDERFEKITVPETKSQVICDIKKLEEYKLVSKNGFSVYCAPFDKLNSVMQEIAYAREVTFRAAGEGTGKAYDSDQFDPHYLHLFLWDDENQKLVGGYRIGRTDEIVSKLGVKALYSRSHYYFDANYVRRLGKALEMGRSFVTPDYQGHPRALDMLWQGIGAYVAKNPEYYTLFGCVSISQEHSEMARAFLSDSMMEAFRAEQEFLTDVRPVIPLKVKGKVWSAQALASLSNIGVINKLLGRCDPGKSVPILLRHYLALNGRFVCFSVNTGFNNSLDGLILVDLRKTPVKYLQRYLGKDGSEEFLNRWTKHEVAA